MQRHGRRNPRARGPARQHVLQPVMPVRHLLAHPIQLALLHAAKPVGLEAQQIAVERVLRRAAVHHESDVDDVRPHCMRIVRSLRMRGRLHKLHLVLLRVEHGKPLAAVRALRHGSRRLPSLRGQVLPHLLGAGHVPRRVVQSVHARARRQRQHLHKLRGAQRIAHACRVLRVCFLCRANDVAIVVLGRRRVRCIDRQVRNARDLRPRRTRRRRGRQRNC